MGGHNKWSQIKRQKGANDAAKSKVWAKLSRRITVESKKAGGDASASNVRSVVETAKKENMPKDAIERAIANFAEDYGFAYGLLAVFVSVAMGWLAGRLFALI